MALLVAAERFNLSRWNVEVGLFQIIARTQRLTGLIDAIARRFRPLWRLFAYVGVCAAFVAMALTTINFLFVGRMLFEKPTEATGVQLVIPGVTVPLLYSLVALMVVVVVHEFAHGIIARLNKIPVKSVGVGILAILPFAFVEPEEEGMKAASPFSRIQVLAAGSMANFTTAFLALAIIFALVVPGLPTTGLSIAGIEGGSPAEDAGLFDGLVITSIDYAGSSYAIGTYDDFGAIMERTSPGEELSLITSAGTYSVVLAQHPNRDV
ncbi:MAG: site-2 protease family protein, partial [Candidatus Methanofastidiosa archaeon]|nr:site-2 protease family protein [Candidatus Methanofastidiosa archaeon]